MKKPLFQSCLLFGFCALAMPLQAADEPALSALPSSTSAGLPIINNGDNAWLLASSAWFYDDRAGMILFYGGLVRTKNVLSTMMHSLILMALISTLWMVLFGYSMAFGAGQRLLREPVHPPVFEGRGRRAQSGLCRDDTSGDLHAVPNDVRHHHPRAHQRCGGRADKIQRVCDVYAVVGDFDLLPAVPHGLGHGRIF